MPISINTIIVDDEQVVFNSFEKLVNSEYPDIKLLARISDTRKALEIIIEKQPDLVFLKIQMPVNDGLWLVNKLNKLNLNTHIIFITTNNEDMKRALEHATFSYIEEPTSTTILKKSIDEFKSSRTTYNLRKRIKTLNTFLEKDKIKFNIYNGFILVSPGDIVYCEAENNYSNLYLSNGSSQMITSQFGVLEKVLAEIPFVKISSTTIINIDYMESRDRSTNKVVLTSGVKEHELEASSSGVSRLLMV